MSNQFSYEVDERQIKVMMLDAELDLSDTAWNKFDESFNVQKKSALNFSVPNINIGISRSIIVPIFFVIMIGGLSSLLFSFVDFKKKPEVIKEIIAPVIKKIIPKPKPPIKSILATVTNTVAQITNTQVATPPDAIAIKTSTLIEITKTENSNIIPEKKKETVIAKVVVKEVKRDLEPVKKKKKRKRNLTEELPIINAPTTNLNEGNKEPEIDLK